MIFNIASETRVEKTSIFSVGRRRIRETPEDKVARPIISYNPDVDDEEVQHLLMIVTKKLDRFTKKINISKSVWHYFKRGDIILH